MNTALELIYNPVGAFERFRGEDHLGLGILLMLVRWTVTPAVTVANMYNYGSGMALRPPFGIEKQTYRFCEILWYGPYGCFMTLVITLGLFLLANRHYGRSDVSFRRVFEIVSLCLFGPWLFTVPGDYFLITTDRAKPALFVTYHILILAWESLLITIGFRRLYGFSLWRSCYLGLASALFFLGLGGLLIR